MGNENESSFCRRLGNIEEGETRTRDKIESGMEWIYESGLRLEMLKYVQSKNHNNTKDAEDFLDDLLAYKVRDLLQNFQCSLECESCSGEAIRRWLLSTLKKKLEYERKRPEVDIEVAINEAAEQPTPDPSFEESEEIHFPDEEIAKGQIFYPSETREIDKALHSAIKKLTKRERQYIIARYFHGAKNSVEVAEILGITPNNARQIKRRALKKLIQELDNDFFQPTK